MSTADLANLLTALLAIAAVLAFGVIAYRHLPAGAGPASGPLVVFPAVFLGCFYSLACYVALSACGKVGHALQVGVAVVLAAVLAVIFRVMSPKRSQS